MIDQWSVGIPFIANLPSTTDLFVTPSLQARIDGSPLSIKGRTKPFAESRESEVAVQLDGLDLPQIVSYAPASLPVAVKSGKLSTDLDVSFSLTGRRARCTHQGHGRYCRYRRDGQAECAAVRRAVAARECGESGAAAQCLSTGQKCD